MKTLGLCLAVFLAEFAWSYCASRVTPHLVRGETLRAMAYDATALLIGYEILAVIAAQDYSQGFIMVAVAGGVLGTGLVAKQEKPKKKADKKVSKKEEVKCLENTTSDTLIKQ